MPAPGSVSELTGAENVAGGLLRCRWRPGEDGASLGRGLPGKVGKVAQGNTVQTVVFSLREAPLPANPSCVETEPGLDLRLSSLHTCAVLPFTLLERSLSSL